MRRRSFLAGSAAFVSLPFGAANANDIVAVSGNLIRMGSDELQLADIIAPSAFSLGSGPDAHVDAARERLQSHLRTNRFQFSDILPPTRWGVRIVRSHSDDGDSTLEERLIADGSARVAPQTDDVDFIDKLLEAEHVARRNNTGLWSLDAYRVFGAEHAMGAIGKFHLVTGTVFETRQAGGRFYLNFADDYRTDFTASTPMPLYRRWKAAGFDLATIKGAQTRIRGFVNSINGPSVELTHSRQIEILPSR